MILRHHFGRILVIGAACATAWFAAAVEAQTTYYVSGACGSDADDGTCADETCAACDAGTLPKKTIQAALDAAGTGDTVAVYRNSTHEGGCYDEHILIDKELTLRGDSIDPAEAACIGPTDGALAHGRQAIVDILADDVVVKDLEISGKAGALDPYGTGGRESGHGIYITGDNVIVRNCTVSFNRIDNIRWQGPANGSVQILGCYIHHADTKNNIRIIEGGAATPNTHVIRNNLIHKGNGVLLTGAIDHAVIEKNIVRGWSYWGHMADDPQFPETNEGVEDTYGGGWRYYSRCPAGIWASTISGDTEYGSNLVIRNNVVYGAAVGIRVRTQGTIRNNTVVNPFNMMTYDYPGEDPDPLDIRNNTYGIMLQDTFSGTIANNIVAVTDDNRANGNPGRNTPPYYLPGITGRGIAFEGNTGSTSGAVIRNNNVWGFVDVDGITRLNYGVDNADPAGTLGASQPANISVDPGFANDSSDETNQGQPPCHADPEDRCYEIYDDNYFLASQRFDIGSCHANIWSNTAAYVGFVDLSNNGNNDPESDDYSGLDDCQRSDDAGISRLIDLGDSAEGMGNEEYPVPLPTANDYDLNIPNLGAFGRTDRASWSPTLRIVGIDVDHGGTKYDEGSSEGNDDYSGPGIVQARSDGITKLNLWFSRPVEIHPDHLQFQDYCGQRAIAAPATSGGSEPPYLVTLTWQERLADQGIMIRVNGTDNALKDAVLQESLDGEFSDPDDDDIPSGDGSDGGDAAFRIYSLVGDVDGDLDVDAEDLDAIESLDGNSAEHLPEDMDGSGVVQGNDGEPDFEAAEAERAHWWVDSEADTNTTGTLRTALNNVVSGIGEESRQVIKFKVDTFAPCSNTHIVNTQPAGSSALPELDRDYVSIDASDTAVIISDKNDLFGGSGAALRISGTHNHVKGLRFEDWDHSSAVSGVYLTSTAEYNVIGGDYDRQAVNSLGEGCLFAAIGKAGVEFGGAKRNSVAGSLFGTDIHGTGAHADGPNGFGLYFGVGSDSNTIGGSDPARRNVVSNNSADGMYVENASGNMIVGNYVGTDVNGTAQVDFNRGGSSTRSAMIEGEEGPPPSDASPLANRRHGVNLVGATSNVIGGALPGEGNVIAGNVGNGITLQEEADFNVVKGNYIGTNEDGDPLGNNSRGIYMVNLDDFICPTANTVGGVSSGEGNVIAYNVDKGIFAEGECTDENQWRGNLVYGHNTYQSEIRLGGANENIAEPEIDSTVRQGSDYVVSGSGLDESDTVDVYTTNYWKRSCRAFHGTVDVEADGTWSTTVPAADLGANESHFVAIRTDPRGNSSEISEACPVDTADCQGARPLWSGPSELSKL